MARFWEAIQLQVMSGAHQAHPWSLCQAGRSSKAAKNALWHGAWGLTLARANWALVYTCIARVPTTLSVANNTCPLNLPCTDDMQSSGQAEQTSLQLHLKQRGQEITPLASP